MNIAKRNASLSSFYRPGFPDDRFGRLVNNFFDGFLTSLSEMPALHSDGFAAPRLKVTEIEHGYQVEAELPGVAQEDIMVSVHGPRVTIEAETRRQSENRQGERVIYAERSARRYVRSFALPSDVDDAKAHARFENGILRLTLPKKESAQVKRLTIQ